MLGRDDLLLGDLLMGIEDSPFGLSEACEDVIGAFSSLFSSDIRWEKQLEGVVTSYSADGFRGVTGCSDSSSLPLPLPDPEA